MERKWLALTPGDTLPLRLGAAVVPDAAALRLPVPEPDVGVRWVHGSTRDTDLAHEAAPRPIGTVQAKDTTSAQIEAAATKAWVVDEASSWECGPSGMEWNKDQYAELQLSTGYEVSVEADGCHVLRKHRLGGWVETVINLSRPELKNGDVLKIRLDAENCDVKVFRQGAEVPQHAPENPRLAFERLKNERARSMVDQMQMAANPPKIMIDPGGPGGDMTAWTKTWVDDKGNVHVEPIKVEDIYAEPSAYMLGANVGKTATGLQMLEAAAARSRDAALSKAIDEDAARSLNRRHCYACGVAEGDEHFLSCWATRPDLLDT